MCACFCASCPALLHSAVFRAGSWIVSARVPVAWAQQQGIEIACPTRDRLLKRCIVPGRLSPNTPGPSRGMKPSALSELQRSTLYLPGSSVLVITQVVAYR